MKSKFSALLLAIAAICSNSYAQNVETIEDPDAPPKTVMASEEIKELVGEYEIYLNGETSNGNTISDSGVYLGVPMNLYKVERKSNSTILYVSKSDVSLRKADENGQCPINYQVNIKNYCFYTIKIKQVATDTFEAESKGRTITMKKLS